MKGRGNGMTVSVFLIFPHYTAGGAGISTWRSAGLSRIGCYGVIGPDPSTVLDKFKRFLNCFHLSKNDKCISMLLCLGYISHCGTKVLHEIYRRLNIKCNRGNQVLTYFFLIRKRVSASG
jgi:hypothetical protein